MKTTLLAAALALTSAGAAQADEPRKLVTILTASQPGTCSPAGVWPSRCSQARNFSA